MRYSRSDTRTRTAVDALAHPDPDRPFLPARRNAQAVPTELSWELLKKLSKELWSTTVDAADMSPGVLSASPSAGSECTLSPAASAFSAILSAFVGSVINGLTSGWLVAFMTGWISWLAVFRVLMSAVYMLYRIITNSLGPGRDEDKSAAAQSDASGHLMAQYNNNNDNNNNNNNNNNNSSSRNNNNGSYSGYAGGWEAPPQIPQWKSRLPQHGFMTNLWPP